MHKKLTFAQNCYKILKTVPRGKVTTYADIARALNTKAYRAVGSAMNKNPNAPIVPCHRVVKSDGTIGGYALGVKQKVKLLRSEGIRIRSGKIVNFEELLFKPEFCLRSVARAVRC